MIDDDEEGQRLAKEYSEAPIGEKRREECAASGFEMARLRWLIADGYLAGRASLLAELNEQCRLNGMGAQRELKLKTEVESLKAEITRLHEKYDFQHLVKENESLKARLAEAEAVLEKIADVTSAYASNRTTSYGDWELREIARDYLAKYHEKETE